MIRSNVDARRLDEVIAIERSITAPDEAGQPIPTWGQVTECRAAVDAEKASERILTSGARSVAAYKFWVRADIVERFSVRETDRIVWKGSSFDVTDVLHQGLRGRLTPILATGGLSDG